MKYFLDPVFFNLISAAFLKPYAPAEYNKFTFMIVDRTNNVVIDDLYDFYTCTIFL